MAASERRRNAGRRSPCGISIGVCMKKMILLALLVIGCRTIGISRSAGGFSEVSPTIAAEMIQDSQQVVVLDVRPSTDYRGPEGHIAGSLNAPFDTIERQLPELLPYQKETVLVYGETS